MTLRFVSARAASSTGGVIRDASGTAVVSGVSPVPDAEPRLAPGMKRCVNVNGSRSENAP